MYKNILFEIRKECVGILTINRPEVLNALNIETFRELNHLLEILETERKIQVLIITGAGRSFAAGADLSECVSADMEDNRSYASLAQGTFNRLEKLPLPVIAAVNGFALGGGCELSLACDIRLAGEKAKFGLPEVSLGVIPCFGATQRLPRLIGEGWAKELIYTGRKLNAEEAKEIGLVNRVVSQEELLEQSVILAEEICGKSPSAVGYAKLSINQGRNMSLTDGLEFEKNISAICYGLPDKAAGMRAFMEKRQPVFPSRTNS